MKIAKQLLLLLLIIMLTSCSATNKMVKEAILNESGIIVDKDYIKYIDKTIPNDEETKRHEGKIHLSFSKNSKLPVSYYLDDKLLNRLDEEDCYLNPGDSIYSDANLVDDSLQYFVFDEFRIYDFSNSKKELITTNDSSSTLVFSIPKDFDGTSISIMPIGKLINRKFLFSTYNNNDLSKIGRWIVKDYDKYDLNYENGIDPYISYLVSYDFSEFPDYYFIYSVPEAKEENGVVNFGKFTFNDSNDDFSVFLHKYIKLNVSGSEANVFVFFKKNLIEQLLINKEPFDFSEEKDINLKVGDVIHLKINKEYKAVSNGLEQIHENTGNSNEYEFKVPDTSSCLVNIAIEKKTATFPGYNPVSIKDANISLQKQDGSIVNVGEELNDNEKVKIIIKGNSGFYISGSGTKDGIYEKEMIYSSYCKEIKKIVSKLNIKKLININLDSADQFGIVTYLLDKKEVSGNISVRDDQELTMNYSLIDDNYKITGKGLSSFISNQINSGSISKNIDIIDSLNGKTITRSDYIDIEKR